MRLRLFPVALLALLSACASPARPVIVPAPTPQAHAENFTVYGADGPLVGAHAVIQGDHGESFEADSAAGGRLSIVIAPGAAGQEHISIAAPGYKLFFGISTFCAGTCEKDAVALERDRVILPRVVARDRRQLGLETGEPWASVEASDFNLLGKVADGDDIEPILAQRAHPDGNPATPGFNLLRVFTAYDICPTGNCPPGNQPIGRLVPREHQELYGVLIPKLADAAARHGLYLELVGFTGPYGTTLPTDDDKVFHWLNLCAAAHARSNIVLELVNEYDNGANRGIPFDKLPDCDGVFTSHGSATEDGTPVTPPWKAATFHPGAGLSGEWQRRPGHDAMDMSTALGVPVWVNEQGRFPDQVSNCAYAYAVARGLVLLAAGGAYHSVHGKHSDLWSGVELECAIQFAAGAHAVPWDCKNFGGYDHPIREEGDTWLRVFRWGPRPECVVFIPK